MECTKEARPLHQHDQGTEELPETEAECTGLLEMKSGCQHPFLTQKLSPTDKTLVNKNLVFSQGASLGNKLHLRVDCTLSSRETTQINSMASLEVHGS